MKFLFLVALLCLTALSAEPLSLDQAVREALAHNGALQITELSTQIARARVTSAYGDFDPSLRFSRGRTRGDSVTLQGYGPRQQTDEISTQVEGLTPWGLRYTVGAQATTLHNLSARTQSSQSGAQWRVTQPLLRGLGFGPTLAPLRIAKANRHIADADFRAQVTDLVTRVIVAYQDVVEARELLVINAEYLKGLQGLVNDNQRRFAIGSLAEADVANARSRSAQVEESVTFYRTQVSTAENRLTRLLGRDGADAKLEFAPLPPLIVPALQGEADLRRALRDRPEVSRAAQEVSRRRQERSFARSELLPQVDLVASRGALGWGGTYQASREDLRDHRNHETYLGVAVAVPLTHAKGRGGLRAARLALLAAEKSQAETSADIALEVTQASLLVKAAQERVEILRQAYDYASTSLEAEIKRLRAGTGQTFFVLQQQGELAQVKSSLVRAQADLRRAVARYQQACGSTLTENALSLP